MLSDIAAMLEDLGPVGELLRRDEVEFFEERDIAVRVVVALNAGESVPVPDTAEVTGHLHDPDTLDTGLLEIGPGKQTGDTAAEDDDIGVFGDGVAERHRRVRIDLVEVCPLALQLEVLRGSLWAQSLVALIQILLPQHIDVDIVGRVRRSARLLVGRHASGVSQSESSCGSPVPMYFDSW